jgi:protein CpxP
MKISSGILFLSFSALALVGCDRSNAPKPAATAENEPAAQEPAQSEPVSSTPQVAATGETSSQTASAEAMERAAERLQRMQSSLDLTQEQSEKLKVIIDAQAPAAQAIRDDQSLSRDQRREKARALWQESDPQIKAILTPEQWTKWEDERSRRRGGGDRQGGGNPPGGN